MGTPPKTNMAMERKSTFLIEDTSSKVWFSIVMLVFRGVNGVVIHPTYRGPITPLVTCVLGPPCSWLTHISETYGDKQKFTQKFNIDTKHGHIKKDSLLPNHHVGALHVGFRGCSSKTTHQR